MAVNQTNEYFKVALAKRAIEDKKEEEYDKTLSMFAEQGHLLPPGMVSQSIIDIEIDRRVDFEIADALAKLERFGILKSSDSHFTALPITQAQIQLDNQWDDIFNFTKFPLLDKACEDAQQNTEC